MGEGVARNGGAAAVVATKKTIRVERSLEDLAVLLGSRPPEWLLPFASIAAHAAEAAAVRRTGFAPKIAPRMKRISIDLTDVPQNDEVARVDAGVRWENRGFALMFSRFEGRIIATRNEDESCTVVVDGWYTPPRRRNSRPDDDAVAAASETAIEMLLDTLRAAVEEQARAGV